MATGAILFRDVISLMLKRSNQMYCMSTCAFKMNSLTNQSFLKRYDSSCYNVGYFSKCHRASKVSLLEQPVRYYAKSRDKKKSDKGHKKKIQLNEDDLEEIFKVNDMRNQMLGAVEKLKDDFIKNLSLRSTSGAIEELPISFEGKEYHLQDLAQIIRKNPKTVILKLDTFPQVIPTVIQTINKSGMNLNPQQDGTTLYIPIPKVTKEYRETLSKNAKQLFIKCRDHIKDIQNKYIKTVKLKEKEGLGKDKVFEVSEYIVFVGSEYISEAEKLFEAKQQELLNEGQNV